MIPTNVAAASTSDDLSETIDPNQNLAVIKKGQSSTKKSCYFCGLFLHANRASCPAHDAVCHNCSKKGHFAKVCQSSRKTTSVNVIYKSSLCTITAACPSGLRNASVQVTINDSVNMTALIDSCSSENLMSEKAFKRLQITATPSSKNVIMALTSMES